HLRALQRARQQGVEDLIAKAIADESDLPHDAIAPKALAAAIVTTLLALQEGFAEHGPPDHPDFFGGASKMLGAALAAPAVRSAPRSARWRRQRCSRRRGIPASCRGSGRCRRPVRAATPGRLAPVWRRVRRRRPGPRRRYGGSSRSCPR